MRIFASLAHHPHLQVKPAPAPPPQPRPFRAHRLLNIQDRLQPDEQVHSIVKASILKVRARNGKE